MRPTFAIATALLLLALSPLSSADHARRPFPCADERGCPDLLVDQLHLLAGAQTVEVFAEEDCPVQEGTTQAGVRQLLRFTYTSPNHGLGDLIVGSPEDSPRWFEYHPCHDHYHFREYADYRLWTPEDYLAWDAYRAANPDVPAEQALANNPALADGLILGEKRGFCIIDIAPSTTPGGPVPDADGKYVDCDDNQGISVGWADTYDLLLDGQWIDITDVAPGAYVLEAEVNAEHVYVEASYSNNRAAVPVAVAASVVP
jgi:hypothetical protein